MEKLIQGLPQKDWQCFSACNREELVNPGRVHIDPFGNVHICQGLIIGNVYKSPLSQIMKTFEPTKHPIIGPLLDGGPAELARKYDVPHQEQFVDECHFCFLLRKTLIEKFPQHLAPNQVYGLPN